MPVSPGTFNHYGDPLAKAGEEVQLEIAAALKTLYQKIIQDPEGVGRYRRNYESAVKKAIKKWRKARQDFVENSLPAAYNRGLRHADAEIKELRKAGVEIGQADQAISDIAPLVRPVAPF
jgi:hypothetical protein